MRLSLKLYTMSLLDSSECYLWRSIKGVSSSQAENEVSNGPGSQVVQAFPHAAGNEVQAISVLVLFSCLWGCGYGAALQR